MKFKFGDIVIIKSTGEVMPVLEVDVGEEILPYLLKEEENIWFDEDELEFENIYNSPLYKALS